MIFVYIQYIYALIAVKKSIAQGYLGRHFSDGLYPKVEKMLAQKGFVVLHPPISGGTVVKILE